MTAFRWMSVVMACAVPIFAGSAGAQTVVPESALRGPVFSLPPPGWRPPPQPPAQPGGASMVPVYLHSLQQSLPHHGYPAGPVTGELDPQTEAGILAYQRDAGLPPDARSEAALQATVYNINFGRPAIYNRNQHPAAPVPVPASAPVAPPARITPPVADASAPGIDVLGVQQRLKYLGYELDATGIADAATERAVKAFQAEHNLPRTGTIDAALVEKLGN